MFKPAGPEMRAELVDFLLDEFTTRQPHLRIVKPARNDAFSRYNGLIDAALTDDVSFVCLDSKNGEILGCCINLVFNRHSQTWKSEGYKI